MQGKALQASYKICENQVPGHQIQIDVKFLKLIDRNNKAVKRFQYTEVDDSTRIRVMKIYKKYTQKNAIDFINHVIEKMPFRIKTTRADNEHESQSQFHCHLMDPGISLVYINRRTPFLNGNDERSHQIDYEEFYWLLEYKEDVELEKKMEIWENFYNFHRPHSVHN